MHKNKVYELFTVILLVKFFQNFNKNIITNN